MASRDIAQKQFSRKARGLNTEVQLNGGLFNYSPCLPIRLDPTVQLNHIYHSDTSEMTLQTTHCKVNACSPPSLPIRASRRIVIATCRPSPFRCRRNCSWTAPWPTRSTTCTLTWQRTRPT